MYTSYWGYPHILQTLLAHGADPNGQDGHGNTALLLAGMEGHAEIVRILLKTGADPYMPHHNGNNALDVDQTGVIQDWLDRQSVQAGMRDYLGQPSESDANTDAAPNL